MRPSLLLAAALVTLNLARPAPAATIYSSLQDIAIPTNFDGVYLDMDTGATATSPFAGWDLNPFFGGVGIANSAAFQPVRIGPGNLDRVLNLAAGTVISGSLTYASGFAGSGDPNPHIGAGANQFEVGTEGYLGFKFTKNGGSGPFYGWMRLTLTNNAAGAVIKDWGYDDSAATIAIGRVQQSAAAANAQTVTLSPGTGETFTLGSAITDTGGNANSVLKTGAGSTTLAMANSFSGTTTVSAGTLEAAGAGVLGGTSAITVNAGGTLLLSNGATTDRINNAATITLDGGNIAFSGNVSEGSSPGTGALTLTADSTIDFGGGHDVIHFGASHLATWTEGATLSIYNWGGSDAGGGHDQLKVGIDNTALTPEQLRQIRFYDGGLESSFLGTGRFVGSLGEVVPIPEPASIFVSLAMLGLVGWREHRKARAGEGASPSAAR